MTPSLEGLPTKAKEAPSPHEVKLALLDTNPVFHSLRNKILATEINRRKNNLGTKIMADIFHFVENHTV